MILSDAQLEEIEKREKAATPGPWWESESGEDDHRIVSVQSKNGSIVLHVYGDDYQDANQGFIAHSRQDIRDLMDTIKALKEELAIARKENRKVPYIEA